MTPHCYLFINLSYSLTLFIVRAYGVSHVKLIIIKCILPKKDNQSQRIVSSPNHTMQIFRQNMLLTTSSISIYSCLLILFKFMLYHNEMRWLIPYVNTMYNPRFSNENNLCIPRIWTSDSKQSIIIAVPAHRNSLPIELKKNQDLNSFKRNLKIHLLYRQGLR